MSEKTMEIEKKEVQSPAESQPAESQVRRARRTLKPRIDLFEAGETIMLLADMPGVNESEIEITLEKDRLTIHAPVADRAPEGYRPIYSEFCIGDFERTFVLSNEIDRDGIEATFKNGVLRLSLPKAETSKARRIAIQSGA